MPAPRSLAGNRIAGPALIEEHASTTVLLPGDTLEVDAYGHLVIKVAGDRHGESHGQEDKENEARRRSIPWSPRSCATASSR